MSKRGETLPGIFFSVFFFGGGGKGKLGDK